ncbi:hypothetical protein BC829DRAFT_448004 [Chytridium lagenaria]|nr:hypothetical protein BC829DRAFT_448004 [Chytridium lagenaria]
MTSNVLHDDDDDVIMVSDNRETITDVENDIRALESEYERAERNRQEFEQLNMKFMELEKKAWPLSGMTVEQRDKIMRKLKEKTGD